MNKKIDNVYPIDRYLQEISFIRGIVLKLELIDVESDSEKFLNLFGEFCNINEYFQKKEEQLFIILESFGWDNIAKSMKLTHDSIRDEIREIKILYKEKNLVSIKQNLKPLFRMVEKLFRDDESILYPIALELLNKKIK